METWSWADVIDAEYVPPKKSNVSDLSWYAEARKMREQGYTLDDIGYKFGRTRERVRQVCEGIEPKGKMPRLRPKSAIDRRGKTMSEEGKARLATLRELADQGLSASQAGARLGITRNAVLGMAFRHKIKFHGPMGRPMAKKVETSEVKAWLASHPFAQQKEAAKHFGVHPITMMNIAKKIRAEWIGK